MAFYAVFPRNVKQLFGGLMWLELIQLAGEAGVCGLLSFWGLRVARAYDGLVRAGFPIAGTTLRQAVLCSVGPSRCTVRGAALQGAAPVGPAGVVFGAVLLFGVGVAGATSLLSTYSVWVLVPASVVVLVAAAIDARTGYLPDALTLPLLAAGLCVAGSSDSGVTFAQSAAGAAWGYGLPRAIGGLYGWVRGRPGMGLGDSKLLGALGAWLGVYAVMPVLFGACVSALVVVGVQARHTGPAAVLTRAVAFGPYLAFSAATVIVMNSALKCPFCTLG